MLTKKQILLKLKQELPILEKEYHIKRIAIFGSYVTGNQNMDSDIDLVLEFSTPIGLKFIQLSDYLEKKLGKNVDILTPDGIKSIRIKSVYENIINNLVYV